MVCWNHKTLSMLCLRLLKLQHLCTIDSLCCDCGEALCFWARFTLLANNWRLGGISKIWTSSTSSTAVTSLNYQGRRCWKMSLRLNLWACKLHHLIQQSWQGCRCRGRLEQAWGFLFTFTSPTVLWPLHLIFLAHSSRSPWAKAPQRTLNLLVARYFA